MPSTSTVDYGTLASGYACYGGSRPYRVRAGHHPRPGPKFRGARLSAHPPAQPWLRPGSRLRCVRLRALPSTHVDANSTIALESKQGSPLNRFVTNSLTS